MPCLGCFEFSRGARSGIEIGRVALGAAAMPYQWLVWVSGLAAIAVAIYICRLAIRWRGSHQRTEQELIEQRRQLDAALNNMSHGLSMFDADGRLLMFNPRYVEMYQLPAELAKSGTSLRQLVAYRALAGFMSTDPDAFCDDLIASMRRGETYHDVVRTRSGRSESSRNG